MASAERKNEYPPSVEADRPLLAFDTWENYLDSLIEIADLRNLRSLNNARIIASLGYRANGDTLSEKEFYKRREVIHEVVFPTVRAYVLVSEGADLSDPFNRELAVRERANRLGILQTIIFIRHFTRTGFEISGYIDYGHRLGTENWAPFFKHNKQLWPRDCDLGYYHWRHGTVRSNISRNFKDAKDQAELRRISRKADPAFFALGGMKNDNPILNSMHNPIMDPEKGLLFQNRHDHKMVFPDPHQDPGQNTIKIRVHSPRYTQIEIYDHVVRKRS